MNVKLMFRSKSALTLLASLLLTLLAAQSGSAAGQQAVVLNNGGSVIQVGDTVYFLHWDDPSSYYSTAIMRMDTLEGKPELLIDAKCGEIHFLDGHLIWDGAYSYDISTGHKRQISNGDVCFVDEDSNRVFVEVSFFDDPSNPGIFSMDVDGDNKSCIAPGICYYLGKDEDTFYFYRQIRSGSTIYAVGYCGENLHEVTSDDSVYPTYYEESMRMPPEIFDFSVSDDRLIYSMGNLQGSMGNFAGHWVSVTKDGKDKRTFDGLQNYSFQFLDGWIYLDMFDGYSPSRVWIQSMRSDFSSAEVLLEDASLHYVIGRRDLMICSIEPMGSTPDLIAFGYESKTMTLLVDGSEYWPGIQEYDSGCYQVEVVGDWVYFYTSVWGYRGNRGWRNELISREFHRIRLDGTGLQTFSRYRSGV